jgi:hypothetical protein
MRRLTTDECRVIGERRLSELAHLDARSALTTFGDQGGIVDELATKDGRPYSTRTWARISGENTVALCVYVEPVPWPDRPLPLGLIDAWRYGRHTRQSVQVRELPL